MPLIALDHVSIAYGHVPLLDDASLQVEALEREHAQLTASITDPLFYCQPAGSHAPAWHGLAWRIPTACTPTVYLPKSLPSCYNAPL